MAKKQRSLEATAIKDVACATRYAPVVDLVGAPVGAPVVDLVGAPVVQLVWLAQFSTV